MDRIVCPKCGQRQPRGNECHNCGVIFARYRGRAPKAVQDSQEPPPPGPFWRAFRVVRWLSLGAMAVIIFLILQQPATPPVDPDPYAGERVQRKLDETRRVVQSGRPHVLELNEAEVNSWLGKNLVFAEMPYEVEDVLEREASLEQVRSTVRNLQVNLSDDEVHAHVVFDFHGKDLKLEIRGKLSLLDGYLKLVPTGGKLGALPIPRAALDRAMSRVFNSPENREKFKVPDQVADLRVEDGEFRVVYR